MACSQWSSWWCPKFCKLFLAFTACWTNDIGELSRVNPAMPSAHRDGSDYFPLDSLCSIMLELRFIYSHRFLRSFWGSPPSWWHLTAQKTGDLSPHPICVASKGIAEGMLSLDDWQRSRYRTLSSALFDSVLKVSEGSFFTLLLLFHKKLTPFTLKVNEGNKPLCLSPFSWNLCATAHLPW